MIAAFDIGGSRIKAARVAAGEITRIGEAETPANDLVAFAAALSNLAGDARAMAISIAGVVDPDTGVATVANIPCLNGTRVVETLQAMLSRPVLVLNDADCFALAETRRGAARGHGNVFGIILGTGVGGGLVIDSHLFPGDRGNAGAVGSMPLLPGSGLLTDLAHARAEAARIGYPVMLKSTAGGGGIGLQPFPEPLQPAAQKGRTHCGDNIMHRRFP